MASYKLTPAAAADVQAITEFTREIWSLQQALDYADDFYDAFDQIAAYPEIGRKELAFGDTIRSKPVASHRVYYRAGSDVVLILRILHAAQDPDAAFPPPGMS